MKKKKQGGGANWMDTYGDMVTLLLCFFVLLFSMSTMDQQKWEELVRSFNPDAIPEITVTEGNDGPNADPEGGEQTQEEIDRDLQQLFQALQTYVSQQGAAKNISVTKGDGYVFISFNDAVFFDGDSYVLRDEGKLVLSDVGEMIGKVSSSIDELRILGHTARQIADEPNNPRVDRSLSSNRAIEVLLYLQDMEILDPARMVSLGMGEWRPVAPNDTSTERAKNRRVEMVVTGRDLGSALGDSIQQYYTMRDDGGQPAPSPDVDQGTPEE